MHLSSISKNCEGTFFCSWSGGKDSALALHKAIQAQANLGFLLTMMIESGDRSRSHGIPKYVLEEQARCIGIPIRFCSTNWEMYTKNFQEELSFFNNQHIQNGIFGDIDIESHFQWVHDTCSKEKITPHLPLWQMERMELLKGLIDSGFKAEIVAVKDGVLTPAFLGKTIDWEMIEKFNALGIDLCGEAGEYHTIVTAGPLFKHPFHVSHGKQVLRDGYWFSDLSLK